MIQWSNVYSVGYEEIDEQHKELIAIINEVFDTLQKKDFHYVNVVDIIDRLERYIKSHFEFEEGLMVQHNYPDIELHASQHNYLRHKVFNTRIFEIDSPRDFYSETLSELLDWLMNHIKQTDKRLADFMNSRQVEQ